MSALKENSFLTGLVAAVVVIGGALAYLLFSASSNYNTTSEAYAAEVEKLHTLQNRIPYPSEENLKKLKELRGEYMAEAVALGEALHKREIPLDPAVTPQVFQDRLRGVVDAMEKRASDFKVSLPEGFYMGFNAYRDRLPSERAAPYLARELEALQNIVEKLIDLKVTAIGAINRLPLPEEQNPSPANQKKDVSTRPVNRFPFEIAFEAEQQRFNLFLNWLMKAKQFFVIRAIVVQNTNPVGPPRNETGANGTQAATTAVPNETPNTKSTLRVIAGREHVRVTARIDMVDFVPPQMKK